MLNAQDAVNSVYFAEKNNERQLLASPSEVSSSQVKNWINPSKRLVDRALDRWYHHNLRADNTSVVTVVIDPPGPPKAQVIRQNQKNYEVRESTSSVTNPTTSKTVPAMILAPTQGHGKVSNSPRPSIQAPVSSVTKPQTTRTDLGSVQRTKVMLAPRVVNKPGVQSDNLTQLVTSQDVPNEAVSKHIPKSIAQKRKHVSSSLQIPASTSVWNASNASNTSKLQHKTRSVQNCRQESSKHDDVQIHEISSSSELSKTRGDNTLRNSSEIPIKRRRPSAKSLASHESPAKATRTKISSDLRKSIQQPVSTSMRTRSGLPRLNYFGLMKKHSLAAAKSTELESVGKSKAKKSLEESDKLDFSLPERSLRSSEKSKTRITRSMKR
jgi:hypothetical protein